MTSKATTQTSFNESSQDSDADGERAASQESRLLTGTNGSEMMSGHHDVKQRRIYMAIFSFSIVNALVGLVLILTWLLNYRPTIGFGFNNREQLANLHPLLMYTFMVSLNMYSVLIYRTHYSQPKERLKWTHAILSAANIVMSLTGVAAMFKSHLMGNMPNFYSLHSWIGALTNVFYVTQFTAGFFTFLKPGLTKQIRATLMPWHRLAGALILVLAATSALTGITEMVIFQDQGGAYHSFKPITFIANFAGVCVIFMTAASIYLLTAAQYRRPPLPGEPHSKR